MKAGTTAARESDESSEKTLISNPKKAIGTTMGGFCNNCMSIRIRSAQLDGSFLTHLDVLQHCHVVEVFLRCLDSTSVFCRSKSIDLTESPLDGLARPRLAARQCISTAIRTPTSTNELNAVLMHNFMTNKYVVRCVFYCDGITEASIALRPPTIEAMSRLMLEEGRPMLDEGLARMHVHN